MRMCILIMITTCCSLVCRAQSDQNYYNALLELDFKTAIKEAEFLDKGASLPYYFYIAQLSNNAGQKPNEDLTIINSLNREKSELLIHKLAEGIYYLYNQPSSQIAFEKLRSVVAERNDNGIITRLAYLYLLDLYNLEIVQSSDDYYNFLSDFKNLTKSTKEKAWYYINLLRYLSKSTKKNSLDTFLNEYRNFEKLFKEKNLLSENVQSYLDYYEALYRKSTNEILKAKNIYLDIIRIGKNKNYLRYLVFGSYIHLCQIAANKNNLDQAKEYLINAEKYWNKSDSVRSRFIYNRFSAFNYFEKANDTATAYTLLKNSIIDEVALDYRNNTLKNSESEIKFQTLEKEKQILLEQQQKKKNRNIAYALGVLLLFGGITFSLIQKNTKRKQLLAEQQKELQTQKLATVLKEQELTAIDAMIEGQEKERQQIANDLHDELGGLMATLKLHFNALQEKPNKDLFGKTENLLDKAYQKIRSVAHTNNSGVMANKGLLKALNEMAETTSQSGKLSVEIVDFGLEKRLENSLELTIFRIVQELLTNVIKHAQATQASVHITQHENSLNIMVEDNGKGFNTDDIGVSKGMGIHSIDKRIDNLGGQVTIDSAPKKGTTVIIDIPV